MEIKAAVLHQQNGEFKVEDIEIDQPKATEVLVKIYGAGICHTDESARQGVIPTECPAVLGHEGAGIVEAVGEDVHDIQVGDHVVLTYASCGHCDPCLEGDPAYCKHFEEINFGGVEKDGTTRLHQHNQDVAMFFGQSSFATYAVADERNVVKVDLDVDIALLGPLGCGIQTGAGTVLNFLKPEFATTIAIYGCGGVGLSAVMAAKIANCKEIIAVDTNDDRLALAKELGATHVINGKTCDDVIAKIKEITNGGTNYAVDTTGVPVVINQAMYALRARGTLALVGVAGEVTFDLYNEFLIDGKTMSGVIEGDSNPKIFIPELVEYYKAGKFPFDKLVTFFNLDEINEAFEASHNRSAIKPILRMPQD